MWLGLVGASSCEGWAPWGWVNEFYRLLNEAALQQINLNQCYDSTENVNATARLPHQTTPQLTTLSVSTELLQCNENT